MAKILFQLPYIVRREDGPDFETFSEEDAINMTPKNDLGQLVRPVRRIHTHIPALEGYGLPSEVCGQILTEDPAVVMLLVNSGAGFRYDRAAVQALLNQTPKDVLAAEPPIKKWPDLEILTKDELLEFAFDQDLHVDKRKMRESIVREIRRQMADKGVKL